jgi:glycosyltransferase involved in cell wall biosynthesis
VIPLTSRQNDQHSKSRGERIAVIVIGRNQGCYLRDCLESVRSQTLAPDQILYVDDASSDDSVAVASAFKNVEVIGLPINLGMCKARMWGIGKTECEFLLFVDGDNTLPPDYLAIMASELREGFDMVYPSKRFFGRGPRLDERARKTPGLLWVPSEHSLAALWQKNYIDTCSMVRRDVLLFCGGWRENPVDTQHDWDLALRISTQHRVKRSAAILNYRLHEQNWSERERGKSPQQIRETVRRCACSITVGTVYSGRLGTAFFYEWVATIRQAVIGMEKTAELVIMDDSEEGCPPVSLRPPFDSVTIQRVHQGKSPLERRRTRYPTAEFLSAVFNQIVSRSKGNVVWFVEDDIIPNEGAGRIMLDALCAEPLLAAVGGYYRSRHGPGRFVASTVGAQVDYVTEVPSERKAVDFTGTGCLMVARPMIGGVDFGIEWHHGEFNSSGHDWVFAWRLKENGTPVIMLPNVLCRHHQTPTEFV